MSHDYRPQDEYDVVAPKGTDRNTLDRALEEADLKLRRSLELGPISVFCTSAGGLGEGRSAHFVSGTSSAPYVGFDLHTLKAEADRDGVTLSQVLRTTLATQLAQAFSEKIGIEPQNEEASEEFAQAFVLEGLVDVDTLRYSLERSTLRNKSGRRR